MATSIGPRFSLGRLVATPGALRAFEASGERPLPYIDRHLFGDWGDLDAEDCATNEDAIRLGLRILSAYHLKDGAKLWIITEADRSSTCLLLPDEY